jgi:hypothetical protein
VICWCMVVEVFFFFSTVENRTCTPIIYHTILYTEFEYGTFTELLDFHVKRTGVRERIYSEYKDVSLL